ncbi:hypothetical protein [Desulfococcus sp.]|uniref:hypothetical protein n=1 Tax=Desulfococcus sp. TaxID=2025834 RepID=UPI0035946178
MNPFDLIPTADPIPAPGVLFWVLLNVFFMIHILLVNIMVGTGVITLIAGLKKDASESLGKDVAQKLPVVIALAINMGVAPLLFLQLLYGQFVYTSSTLMAVFWLSAVALLIIAYTNAYYYKSRFDALSIGSRRFFLGSAVFLFLTIGFVLSNNMTLMINPSSWFRYFIRPDGFLLNLKDAVLLPRYLHFMTASLAVGGLFIAAVWTFKKKKGAMDADKNIRLGMQWFTGATLAQILVGFWFQMSLPKAVMALFMGDSNLHTAVFMIALALVIQTLYYGIRSQVWPSVASVTVLIAVMILMRDLVRTAYLKPYFSIRDLSVIQENGPMILFFMSLVLVSAAILWVLRLLPAAERKTASPKP